MSDSFRVTQGGGWFRRAAIEAPIIVTSILLAFAIDAGWDLRQHRMESREILEGLRAEYLEHRDAYRARIDRAEERMSDIQTLFLGSAALEAGVEQVERSLFQLLTVSTVDPGEDLRDALISSGKLELISSPELRLLLAEWEGVVDEVRDNQDVMRQLVASQLVPYLSARGVPLVRVLAANGPTHPLWPPSLEWPETRQTLRVDLATYRQVLEDEEFQSYVSVRYLWLAWTLTELDTVMTEIERILDGVETELGVI